MKIKVLLIAAGFCSAFAACHKCETCSAYNKMTGLAEPAAQTVEVCRKAEIDAYQTGDNFIAPNGDSVKFVCVPVK